MALTHLDKIKKGLELPYPLGFGAANIVPIMFGAAGKLTDISASMALTIVMMGYTVMLLGPAFIGFVAEATTLSFALSPWAAPYFVMSRFSSNWFGQPVKVSTALLGNHFLGTIVRIANHPFKFGSSGFVGLL